MLVLRCCEIGGFGQRLADPPAQSLERGFGDDQLGVGRDDQTFERVGTKKTSATSGLRWLSQRDVLCAPWLSVSFLRFHDCGEDLIIERKRHAVARKPCAPILNRLA